MADIQKLETITSQVRRDIVRMVNSVNSGHPGGSLGCTEFFVALYNEVMDHDPSNFQMNGEKEDVFFLSQGHISPVWYSVLAHSGYFPVSELATFRKLNSRLQGHPTTHEGLPGIRIASGSLGQGLSVAIGAAQAKKLNGDDKTVYCLMGDGEQQEGQVWEALMYAPHNKVDNLITIVDYNNAQIDGAVDEILSLGNLKNKYEAFGWKVLEMDGNNFSNLLSVLAEAKSLLGSGVPIMIIMTTIMGNGVDFMMGTNAWHGKAPSDEQTSSALEQNSETLGDF
ncbi:MAG: transketolase [Flavobacteriales bacterium]|nr:transketolase [Flavobacteriales bacterium]|tara:strand:- start:32332 stop:33177 length:846 start_codon:yes stop_codon:yes gene_type:complete